MALTALVLLGAASLWCVTELALSLISRRNSMNLKLHIDKTMTSPGEIPFPCYKAHLRNVSRNSGLRTAILCLYLPPASPVVAGTKLASGGKILKRSRA